MATDHHPDAELLLNELDVEFKYRIAAKMGDAGFMHCLACGSCTASCPIRRLEDRYNPRRIIRLAILGFKEEVFRSEFVWLCSYHSTCYQRCPQKVNIGAVCDAVVRSAAAPSDREFRKQVLAQVPDVANCFVCGSCTAVCPESLLDPKKDPRRFIRKVNLGLKEQALADEFKDICATHFRCLSRCPQGVRISEIMQAIRELAVEDGYSYPQTLAARERSVP